MSIARVREYFKQFGMEDKIFEFDVSSATVDLAAVALNCEGKRIGKTMSFLAHEDVIVILTAGDAKIDNSKYKKFFGTKAKMIPYEEAEALTGHAPGGVCPFAVNEGVKIYLDVSIKRFETIFPACGSSNSAIELTIPEIEKYTDYIEWIDVCKGWEEE